MALDSAVVVSTGNQVIQIATWVWPLIISLIGVLSRHHIDKIVPKKKIKAETPKA